MARKKITDGSKRIQVYTFAEERAVEFYGKPVIQKMSEEFIKEQYKKDVGKLPKPK